MANDKIKTHCYARKCGPVVTTGAVQSIWYVCKECGQEVTKHLKEQIDERIAIKEEGKDIIPDGDDDLDLFGLGYTTGANTFDPDGYY